MYRVVCGGLIFHEKKSLFEVKLESIKQHIHFQNNIERYYPIVVKYNNNSIFTEFLRIEIKPF